MKKINKKNWIWKPKKWWITLLIFWFLSLLGSFTVKETVGGGFIIFMMLIIVIYSVIEDIRWDKNWKKILWVLGMWLFHGAILMFLSTFLFAVINFRYFDGKLGVEIFRLTYIISATPIILYSMSKSKKFMQRDV